jgi:hypothetical protein
LRAGVGGRQGAEPADCKKEPGAETALLSRRSTKAGALKNRQS